MDNVQRGIITLLQSGLTGKALPLPADFDIEKAYPVIQKHRMIPLAYEGAILCGVSKAMPVMQKMLQTCFKNLLKSEAQMHAIERLCDEFETQGIDYLCLKGCNLKKLYPKQELRPMGDADILIRNSQYESIKPIMVALGYKEGPVGPYDYTWETSNLHLELHRQLAASRDKDYHTYFGDGWEKANLIKENQHQYIYTDEDQLIYLFMHFTKHYRDSGIGLKHAIDIWVYNHAKPNLNHEYLKTELQKLRLWEFYQNVLQMLEVWFNNAECDERSTFITDYIFGSGAFGKQSVYAVSAAAREVMAEETPEKAKQRRLFRLAFPNVEALQNRYPILRDHPKLLPIFWPVRWITAVLFRREHIRMQQRELTMITPDKIETYQEALRYVGLNLDFEE